MDQHAFPGIHFPGINTGDNLKQQTEALLPLSICVEHKTEEKSRCKAFLKFRGTKSDVSVLF
jgi:hypothetical protein